MGRLIASENARNLGMPLKRDRAGIGQASEKESADPSALRCRQFLAMHELVERIKKFDGIIRIETVAEAKDGNLLVCQPGPKRSAPLVSGQ
jgi:hypothetical protein